MTMKEIWELEWVQQYIWSLQYSLDIGIEKKTVNSMKCMTEN